MAQMHAPVFCVHFKMGFTHVLLFCFFCRYQNHQDQDQNSSHGKINVPLVSECSQVVKCSNRDHLHLFLQTLISSEVYYEPIKSENRGH